MGRAELVLQDKVIDEDGDITEPTIWKVPVSLQPRVGRVLDEEAKRLADAATRIFDRAALRVAALTPLTWATHQPDWSRS